MWQSITNKNYNFTQKELVCATGVISIFFAILILIGTVFQGFGYVIAIAMLVFGALAIYIARNNMGDN